ncbi:MAG TPA: VanZ family protein [Bryobacteraceae bacterium]
MLLYLAVILYLSLYPWRFIPQSPGRTLVWVPLTGRFLILDAFLNLVFYVPLGAAAFLSLRRGWFAFLAAAALGTFVSFAVESLQLSIPNRVGNLLDLLANSAGAVLGAAIAFIVTGHPIASRLARFQPRTLLLWGLWAIWQVFTFLLPHSWSTIDILHEIVGSLTLALLAFDRMLPAAGALLLAWLAFDELRPFHFHGPPGRFWWLPFESWFVGAAESYYGLLFGKLFFYTAIQSILRASNIRWVWALAWPAAILALGEWAQRYLPGRTPEATDMVLLAAGAMLLNWVQPDNRD